jgi:hypothetical protein
VNVVFLYLLLVHLVEQDVSAHLVRLLALDINKVLLDLLMHLRVQSDALSVLLEVLECFLAGF